MKITVLGTGYQGLVTGTCLADNGHQVTCVDRDAPRIHALTQGKLPIHEPGLEELVARNLEEERLTFTTDLAAAIAGSLTIFLCVGTPLRPDGSADTTEVLQATRELARTMDGYRILVNKATCPPGTAEQMQDLLRENSPHPFDIVVNPDFLKEGTAIDDFMRPDRIVLGCDDIRVREILKELYAPFLRTGRPCLLMSPRSAELTKFATNAFLAARISLINQIADLCEATGADINEVRDGIATDERIGQHFLFPGLGFGGLGLPKDLATAIHLAQEHHTPHDLLSAILDVNNRRIDQFLARILAHYGGQLGGKKLALWGASFKPRTDDLRGALSLKLIDQLRAHGAQLAIFDPVAAPKLRELYGDALHIASRNYDALQGAHGLIIATEWSEFRRPDYDRMASLMQEKTIFDGRNLYTPATMKQYGFTYHSIGRPAVLPG